MNSKAAQLRENGTEIVRLFARLALGASFLSAVADRFGLWGPYGAKNVSWGNFAHFVEYTGEVTSLFPSSSTVSFAWAATVAETLCGILLIAGFKIRMASVLSGLLLLSFAIGMDKPRQRRTRGHWKPPTCEPDAIVAGRHRISISPLWAPPSGLKPSPAANYLALYEIFQPIPRIIYCWNRFTEGRGLVWACGLGPPRSGRHSSWLNSSGPVVRRRGLK